MNWSLIRSVHAYVCIAILGAVFVLYWLAGWPLELSSGHPSRTLRLGSGVASLSLLIGVGFYVVRKYAHRGGYSPEFLMRVPYEAIEKGNKALLGLQVKIDRGTLISKSDILKQANRALKESGSARINRAVVHKDASGALHLSVAPKEPLGRVARWMRTHVWYGWLFGPVVLFHGGLSWGSTIGQVLIALSLVVWISGLIGLVLWAKGPAYLTKQETDLSIEEAFSLAKALAGKVRDAHASLPKPAVAALKKAHGQSVGREIDPSMWSELCGDSETHSAADLLALMGQCRNVQGEQRRLQKVRRVIMAWKLVHIPAAIVLAVTTLVHLISIVVY